MKRTNSISAKLAERPQIGSCVKVVEIKSAHFHRCLCVRFDSSNDVAWDLGPIHQETILKTPLTKWLFNASHCGCSTTIAFGETLLPGLKFHVWPSAKSEQESKRQRGEAHTQGAIGPKGTMVSTSFLLAYLLRQREALKVPSGQKLRAFRILEALLSLLSDRVAFGPGMNNFFIGVAWFSLAFKPFLVSSRSLDF